MIESSQKNNIKYSIGSIPHASHADDEDVAEEEEAELELAVTKLSEVKTDPMGPVADVLIVAAELADKNLSFFHTSVS